MKKFTIILVSLAFATVAFAAETPSFNITIKDHKFIPETVEIPAGQKVQLVVKNEGPGAEEFESHDLNREKVIAPGKTVTIAIGPLKPGTYGFFGEFHPSTAQGKVIVK